MEIKIITTDDAAKVSNRLNRYAHRAQNTLPVMEDIALDMLRVEGLIFSSNGRRGGGSWKQLKKDTVRKKGSVQILRTSEAKPGYSFPGNDALHESLTRKDAPYQIRIVSRRGIEFGTSVPGAAAQQAGAPSKGIPPRPFLRFLQTDIDRWDRMILDYLVVGVE